MSGWENFFVGQVGASAALAGLVFVAVSINLARILTYPSLPSLVLEAIVPLVAVLIASSLLLVPGQPLPYLGGELALVGLIMAAVLGIIQWDVLRKTEKQYRGGSLWDIFLGQAAAIAFVVAGASIALVGSGGVYWVVPATLLSYLVAISEAWVLLIEINR